MLVVDLDSQANASMVLFPTEASRTTAHALLGECTLEDVAMPSTSPGVMICPSSSKLAQATVELANHMAPTTALARAMQGLSGYDYVFIDTPPEQGLLTTNALAAATGVVIPFIPDPMAIAGLHSTRALIRRAATQVNPLVHLLGMIQVDFDVRQGITKKVREGLQREVGEELMASAIRTNTRFQYVSGMHQDIFQLETSLPEADRKGTLDFINAASELELRIAAHA